MKAVLGFLKRNLFNIICTIVALGSIGLGVFGMTKMSDVERKLAEVKTLHGQFSRVAKDPVNKDIIEAEQRRVQHVQEKFAEFMDVARPYNTFDPLTPPQGEVFFPEPTRDGKLQFRDIYLAAFDQLLERLNSGFPPSATDIAEMREIMEQEERAKVKFAVDESEDDEIDDSRSSDDVEEPHPSGLITTAQALESAASRAAINRAKSIFCYADREAFDINPTMVDQGAFSVPEPDEMWKSQLTLWMQQDIVESLARINDIAAQKLKSEGQRAWVGVLPIKDVISIRVGEYLTQKDRRGQRDLLGPDPADALGPDDKTFTEEPESDLYERARFTIKLVVDPRELLHIIDEICKDRFHTLVEIAYVYEREWLESLDMTGKIFGEQPAVKVMMDFETIFLAEYYRRLMPQVVLDAIGKKRPEDDESDDSA